MRSIRSRVSYANVVSTLALFFVLAGGSAFAATQLAKNSVGPRQIKKNAVTAAKIKANAVTGAKIAANAVSAEKIADGAVSSLKIADSAIGTGKLAAGAVTTGKIADGSVGPEKLSGYYLPAGTAGVPLAGINVSSSGGIDRWFNRVGGEPSVKKEGTGVYIVTFPGLVGQVYFETSIAIASLTGGPGEVQRGSSSGNPRIATFNSAGSPADKSFSLIVFLPGTEP